MALPSSSDRPLYCPICQSPDVVIAARLTNATVCVCSRCSAEFTLKPATMGEGDGEGNSNAPVTRHVSRS